jgi:hypothetical protein
MPMYSRRRSSCVPSSRWVFSHILPTVMCTEPSVREVRSRSSLVFRGVVVTTILARPMRTAGRAAAYQNSGYLLLAASSYQSPCKLAPRIRSGVSAK